METSLAWLPHGDDDALCTVQESIEFSDPEHPLTIYWLPDPAPNAAPFNINGSLGIRKQKP